MLKDMSILTLLQQKIRKQIFSKSFSVYFNDLINYINIENKESNPEYLNRIIERIET